MTPRKLFIVTLALGLLVAPRRAAGGSFLLRADEVIQ